ncbi:MAG: hypothetical protein KJ927_02715, partial [Candidatus Eisenbacteria bacterium]|nr:hypothetical protein [Candidatus Eisenbacteria bacterium]
MTTRRHTYRPWMLPSFLILAGLFFSVAANADAPVLVIEPGGHPAHQFLIDEIENITFSGDAMTINGWDGWLNERSLGSVQEIWVRWLMPSGLPEHDI